MKNFIMSEDLQQGQPLSFSDEEEPFTPHPPHVSGKRPRPTFRSEEEEGEDLLPLLSDFFADFEISVPDQIAICRSYASHLAAVRKGVAKKKE